MHAHLLLLSLALIAAGCTGTGSILATAGNAGTKMYPLSESQADCVVASAKAACFAGSPIVRVEIPNKGCQAPIRFALDSHIEPVTVALFGK